MKGAAGNGRNEVLLALLMTATIHLGGLGLALFAPGLLPENLQVPEVYQVELYTATEAPPPQPDQPPVRTEIESPAITAPPPPATAPPKVQTKPTIPPLVQPRARPKAVSLSPIKERLLRENQEREELADRNRQLTDRVTNLKLDLQRQKAEEQAREAARLAREAIAETYRAAPVRTNPTTVDKNTKPRTEATPAPTSAAFSGTVSPEIQSAYKAELRGHIGQHWSLPDLQGWDKSLKTVINIKMKSNGMVSAGGVTVASSSGNPRFDKEARKAVNNSLPLPPLPPEFGKDGEEIAVTFTPVGLK